MHTGAIACKGPRLEKPRVGPAQLFPTSPPAHSHSMRLCDFPPVSIQPVCRRACPATFPLLARAASLCVQQRSRSVEPETTDTPVIQIFPEWYARLRGLPSHDPISIWILERVSSRPPSPRPVSSNTFPCPHVARLTGPRAARDTPLGLIARTSAFSPMSALQLKFSVQCFGNGKSPLVQNGPQNRNLGRVETLFRNSRRLATS